MMNDFRIQSPPRARGGKRGVFFPVCVLLLLLGGCAGYQEMSRMDLVAGLAIDREGEEYTLTIETLNLSGPPEDSELKSYPIQAKGATLSEALEAARRQTAGEPHFGNMEVVVLQESLVREGGLQTLIGWLWDEGMRETLSLFISREETAGEILSAKGIDRKIASYTLECFVAPPGGGTRATIRVPLYRAAEILSAPDKSLRLPAVAVQPGSDDTGDILKLDGLAVFQGDTLAEFLEQGVN